MEYEIGFELKLRYTILDASQTIERGAHFYDVFMLVKS